MRIRTRNTGGIPAPRMASEEYDERVAAVLVSTRRVEPHRIDAVRDPNADGTVSLEQARLVSLYPKEVAAPAVAAAPEPTKRGFRK